MFTRREGSKPTFEEVEANAKLTDAERIEKAWHVITAQVDPAHAFWTTLTSAKKQAINAAILKAHYSCIHPEGGADRVARTDGKRSESGIVRGSAACIYSYTREQIKEKFAIQMEA